MVKRMCYLIFFIFLSYSVVGAHVKSKIFPGIKHNINQKMVSNVTITNLEFSNSLSGPFTSNLVLYAGDSLFIKMDVTPLGSIQAMFYLDINENSIIDSIDMPIGGDIFIDNNTTPPYNIDLNPTEGIIVSFIETDVVPSMTVIARATENSDTVEAIVKFINKPGDYTLDGIVYDDHGFPLMGAWVFITNGSVNIGDATDTSGYYSIPLDGGTYELEAFHLSGMYAPFDTAILINGNTTLNITLSGYNSYIRGYVRDELSNPIRNVTIWSDKGGDVVTDDDGMYILMVPPGDGVIGVNDWDLYPKYLTPMSHNYFINDNDSIVNTPVSNFICYSTDSHITGQIFENGSPATGLYRINAWSNDLQSSSFGISTIGGNYDIPVHSGILMPMYGINVADWDEYYPWPSGYYPDTSYSMVMPGASGLNFNFIPAETLFTESFTGDMVPPDYSIWNVYQYGNIGGGSTLTLEGNRLKVQSVSNSGTSGYGLVSTKPFRINEREYRIYVDKSALSDNDNSVRIILANQRWNGQDPDYFFNSLQLIYERDNLSQRRWRLMSIVNNKQYNLWTSYDSTGHHILFQFVHPDTLVLKIHSVEDFRGRWGSRFSIAYLYLTEFNSSGQTSSPVYFDEIFVGPLGSTSIREIDKSVPDEFSLKQNYPNPFNPVTFIQYDIHSLSHVSVDVYNVLGEHVTNLVNQIQAPGKYEVSLFANDLPSGVYYYRMNAINPATGTINANIVRKAILIK